MNAIKCKAECIKADVLCAAYEFDTVAESCKIYNTGANPVLGDSSIATKSCLLFKAPTKNVGKCVWFDKKVISDNYYVDKTALITIDDCRDACVATSQFCSAFQFNTADTLCRLFNTQR